MCIEVNIISYKLEVDKCTLKSVLQVTKLKLIYIYSKFFFQTGTPEISCENFIYIKSKKKLKIMVSSTSFMPMKLFLIFGSFLEGLK